MPRKTIIYIAILIIFAAGTLWYLDLNKKSALPQNNTNSPKQTVVAYRNTSYGFSLALPDSWQGYTVVAGQWQGVSNDDQNGEIVKAHGPLISIRHPLWTKNIPRQDIPIMVFTISQWNDLGQDKFHIGAAPIGPSELGRNTNYVFALPARYNFAFPEGYTEVEQILNNKPLQTF